MEDRHSSSLFWIHSSVSDPPSERAKMRRQVTKNVALRRKNEPKHPHPNVRQYPVFVSSDSDLGGFAPGAKRLSNHDITGFANKNGSDRAGNSDVISAECDGFHGKIGMPISRGVRMICPEILVQCNLDFLDLSLLTSQLVGRFTGPRLLECPETIPHFLGNKARSYCQYVPFYYSQSAVIRNATDCAVARARFVLSPEGAGWESLALSSYAKALSSLQEAISAQKCPTVETLCATQILGVYEVSAQ